MPDKRKRETPEERYERLKSETNATSLSRMQAHYW